MRPQDLKLSDLALPVKNGIVHVGNKLMWVFYQFKKSLIKLTPLKKLFVFSEISDKLLKI